MLSITLLTNIAYLVAASLFVLGLKSLARPRTAIRGNRLSALGMLIALVVTLLDRQILRYELIIAALVLGGLIGALLATRIHMTAMPQMVALLNGFGGGASLLVAVVAAMDYFYSTSGAVAANIDLVGLLAIGAAVLIGAVTVLGSLVAFGKLQAILPGGAIGFTGLQIINALLLASAFFAIYQMIVTADILWLYVLIGCSALLGLLLVLPIGGADMPVVIALLNAYSGIAVGQYRFYHEQYFINYCRFIGWCFGHYSDQNHVRCDEPLAHQCIIWRDGRR